jgi:hypothetical protein
MCGTGLSHRADLRSCRHGARLATAGSRRADPAPPGPAGGAGRVTRASCGPCYTRSFDTSISVTRAAIADRSERVSVT